MDKDGNSVKLNFVHVTDFPELQQTTSTVTHMCCSWLCVPTLVSMHDWSSDHCCFSLASIKSGVYFPGAESEPSTLVLVLKNSSHEQF